MERRKEMPLFSTELIVVVDHEDPNQPIAANVQRIIKHSQEGERGEKALVVALDGRNFSFSTLLRIGLGKFTDMKNRYVFHRASLLDPKDPKDRQVIINTMKNYLGESLNGQDQTPKSQNGQPDLK